MEHWKECGLQQPRIDMAGGQRVDQAAAAVSPADALEAIWRFDAAHGRYVAFAPHFPQASDLLLLNRLDAVFLCLRAPGILARPII